jgi:2-(1,2-epoxy-1,2-dihydrophenyl)acetyl-CoA isomerase
MASTSTADAAVLQGENHGPVRVLRLNRPERKNALTSELGWSIVEAVREAAADDAVRVVGLTGQGDAFCSGVDLRGDSGGDVRVPLSPQEAAVDDLGWIQRLLLVMRVACEKPVVAGVNGVAVGAGLSLAMCADVRVASAAARFHPGYARAGTSPDGGLTWTLPQAVGHERAMRFLLDQRMISAAEAAELGLVGEVVDVDGFEARFLEYCATLAEVAPIAARQTKRMLVRSSLPADLEAHLRDELRNARRGLASEDGKEAVAAILEKRKPEFRGR